MIRPCKEPQSLAALAINCMVAQNKHTSGFSFPLKFVVQQRFEVSQNNATNAAEIRIKHESSSSEVATCKIYIWDTRG